MSARNRLLRLPAVLDRVGLWKTAVYQRVAAKTFPAPVKLGPRAVAWVEADIDAWLDRVIERGGQGGGE